MQIQISWLLQKPTDLDLHCLQNRVYPGSGGQGLRLIMPPPEAQGNIVFGQEPVSAGIDVTVIHGCTIHVSGTRLQIFINSLHAGYIIILSSIDFFFLN